MSYTNVLLLYAKSMNNRHKNVGYIFYNNLFFYFFLWVYNWFHIIETLNSLQAQLSPILKINSRKLTTINNDYEPPKKLRRNISPHMTGDPDYVCPFDTVIHKRLWLICAIKMLIFIIKQLYLYAIIFELHLAYSKKENLLKF